MTDLNIRAMLELSHRFAKAMVQKGSGKILIVASCGGFQPGPGMNTYFATKAFDLHFAEALDEELLGTGYVAVCYVQVQLLRSFSMWRVLKVSKRLPCLQ